MRTPEEPWSYGLFIPHDPRAVGVVRATIRHVLRAARLDCIVGTAELLVSELVTNAYRNTTTDAYVSMDWEPTPPDFRVTVWDSGCGLPQQVVANAEDESGRGLTLVESCSDTWGVRDYTDKDTGVTGKAVWFTLTPPPPVMGQAQ
ncbi:ATP-binding protein [Streptomyces violaceusniger]|uniref:ATP-binding region ATPase domain protein n=1 Tax=Streptomyces violaceusniger (strain Tu 4113) TaxID=653045 RepID=G2NSX4_STRV4|nr:ATP-binding protein [Streptomyces violaceusniger]AEM81163.1 ATP-binding region ATPase domain protein [Streptomyces violaceusniger Tu 4113]